MKKSFSKTLSANDVGATGAHQAGMLVPKGEKELLEFLPRLDSAIKNPDAWIRCIDEDGRERKFRFVYYNNKRHDPAGTRDEYRLTYMTSYLREMRARENDILEISRADKSGNYAVRIVRAVSSIRPSAALPPAVTDNVRIKITSGWRQNH
ncbi:MAG: EcoRII N-terminal effector-binding domain-containing protein [Pseudomonadota bacterium]